jgi:CheY-like chemotaxis protein
MVKILIVDDDPVTLGIMEEVVGSIPLDIEVFSAEHGLDALRVAEAERPSVVFLDATMPLMDGFEACAAMKNDLGLRDTYVVMVTGLEGDGYREKGLAAGVDQYMVKPFDPDDLIDIVEEIVGRER